MLLMPNLPLLVCVQGMGRIKAMGIKPKLHVAFGCIKSPTLAASAIALFSYTRFSESLGVITQQSVPLMAESMGLGQHEIGASARVPLLAHSASEDC